MNKNELINHFREWRDNDENEKIIAAALALPESSVDDEVLSWLAQAYIDIEEYKRAIAVLESVRGNMDNDYKWQFMMGLALLRAADDDECEDDDELRCNILERAKVCIARGMNMNPPNEVLESADRFMEEIEALLEELGEPDDPDYDEELEAYDDDELDAVEEHIKEYFGDFPTVFHEKVSKDIICDIACIPPTEEKNYYTLVTMGMGAHLMNIPDSLPADENGRAELLICLPPEWKLGESSDEWFWPIHLIKDLARLPVNTDSWLGWGHSVDHQAYLALNTKFCASLLLFPEGVPDEAEVCTLPNGDKVNFFEVIPMYREEMLYKINHDTKSLLERMKDVSHIVDINRPNCCEDAEEPEPDSGRIIDFSGSHAKKIEDKGLPLDPINGCNHLAVFLRWCIEHSLIAPEFYENCPDIVDGVTNGSQTDLREFINEYFGGYLKPFQFSYMGACFTNYYYNWDDNAPEYFYPSDVDYYAERYFGTERYNSEEFQDEAYMFVPFDEDYYKGLSKLIDRAFADFLPDFVEYCANNDKETAKRAEDILGLKLTLPNPGEQVAKCYRDIEYMAKAGGSSALPIIIDPSAEADTPESLADLLLDATDTFLETIAIVKFPSADPMSWVEKEFSKDCKGILVIPTDERILSLQKTLKEMLGAVPAVLTLGEPGAALLIPLENGVYVRVNKKR